MEDICHVETIIFGHTNTGTSKTNWVGKYGGVESWLGVSCISNIFSVPSFKKLGYHVRYDSDGGYYLGTNRKKYVATKFIYDKNGPPYV